MKTKNYFFLIVAIFLILCSCGKEDEPTLPGNNNSTENNTPSGEKYDTTDGKAPFFRKLDSSFTFKNTTSGSCNIGFDTNTSWTADVFVDGPLGVSLSKHSGKGSDKITFKFWDAVKDRSTTGVVKFEYLKSNNQKETVEVSFLIYFDSNNQQPI